MLTLTAVKDMDMEAFHLSHLRSAWYALYIFIFIDLVYQMQTFALNKVLTACLLSERAAIFPWKLSSVLLLNVVNVHFWARSLSRKHGKCWSEALWREEDQSGHGVMTQHKSLHTLHVSVQLICNKQMMSYPWDLGLIILIWHPKMYSLQM